MINESGPSPLGATDQKTAGEHVMNSVAGGDLSATPAWQRAGGGAAGRHRRPLSGIASVLIGQPWFVNASPERRRQVLQVVQEAAEQSVARKARVAAYPDLAQRLRRVLGLQRFEQWSGYMPPRSSPNGGEGGTTLINTLPIRRELVSILHEVVEREAADQHPAVREEAGEQPCL